MVPPYGDTGACQFGVGALGVAGGSGLLLSPFTAITRSGDISVLTGGEIGLLFSPLTSMTHSGFFSVLAGGGTATVSEPRP